VVESLGADHVVLEEIKNPNGEPFFDLDKNRYIFFSPQAENKFLEVKGIDEITREVRLSDPCTTLDNDFCSIREGDNVFRVNAYTITLDQEEGYPPTYSPLDVDGDGIEVDGDGDRTMDLYIYSNTNDLVPDAEIAAAGEANASTAEVAEGIEGLQFQFGWDMNEDGEINSDKEDPNYEYVDDPTGFEDQIRAVRIYVLARSLIPDPQLECSHQPTTEYELANYTRTLDDDDCRFHWQLFEEIVMVRNMNL
jgi:hypothetical protein